LGHTPGKQRASVIGFLERIAGRTGNRWGSMSEEKGGHSKSGTSHEIRKTPSWGKTAKSALRKKKRLLDTNNIGVAAATPEHEKKKPFRGHGKVP